MAGRSVGTGGRQCCFAYVIAALGRVLHTFLDPRGTRFSPFIITNSSLTTQHKTTMLIQKQTDGREACVLHAHMHILG